MVVKFEDACCPTMPQTTTHTPQIPAHRGLEMREFIGNAKRITIECNRLHLRIIGNGNKIFVTCNTGKLEIIGNNNRVKIVDNTAGKVFFIGNNCKIYLSSESVGSKAHTNVRFSGLNGCVKLVPSDDLRKKTSPSTSPITTQASRSDTEQPPASTDATKLHSSTTNHKSCPAKSPSCCTSVAATSSSTQRHKITSLCASDDDLTRRQFDQQPCCAGNGLEISVNNMNGSLDNLSSVGAVYDVHITGRAVDVRISAAKSNLVINNLV